MEKKVKSEIFRQVKLPIHISKDGVKFRRFVILKDDHACAMINRLLGKMWTDIQHGANMEPVGKCPVKEVRFFPLVKRFLMRKFIFRDFIN